MPTDLKKLIQNLFNVSLYWYQLNFLRDCLTKERVLGVFCRQTGKSMTIAIAATLKALEIPGGHIVIVSHTDRQAGELFLKISNFIENSPIKQEVKSITQRALVMNNGCRITALPTGDSGSTIRGMTADVLIMEEAAFIKDTIVSEVLMPMVAATRGKVIKISTPFGMNHFYKSFNNQEWSTHRVNFSDAIEVGQITQMFINEQIAQYGETSIGFRTEYGAEFIADQDNYFGFDLIESCINDMEPKFKPDHDKDYYLGADIARFGADSTVLTIVEKGSDMIPHKVVQIKEMKGKPLDIIIEEIYEMNSHWNFKKIFIDETGLGAGVTDVLKRKMGDKFEPKDSSTKIPYGGRDKVIGITFTMKSKLDIYSNIRTIMEQGKLVFPNNNKLIFQLRDFKYTINEETGNIKLHHSDGGNDDYCDSLALACKGLSGRQKGGFFFG